MKHGPKKDFDLVGDVGSPNYSEVCITVLYVLLVSQQGIHATSAKEAIIGEAPGGDVIINGVMG